MVKLSGRTVCGNLPQREKVQAVVAESEPMFTKPAPIVVVVQ